MTRLVALLCPACNTALVPTGERHERVLCCARCPTGVDIAHDGLQPYPVRDTPGGGTVPRGLYWELAGDAKVVAFAATDHAHTLFGTFAKTGDSRPFFLTVPARPMTIVACHAETLERGAMPLPSQDWSARDGAPPPTGVLGRREAERVAHQAIVTLITQAKGEIHHLDLTLAVHNCKLVRAI